MRTVLHIMTMLMLAILAIWAGYMLHPLCAGGAAIICMWECKTWGDREFR